jgi:hypothetical protein
MQIKKAILFFLTGMLLVVSSAFYKPTQTTEEEYSLKAAFLYRFTDYVDWGNTNTSQDFTIAVLGESEIIAPLNEIAKNKKVKDKAMDIKQYNDINDIGACQVIFISKNYAGSIEAVISKIGDKPVLIIAEQNGACEKGACINFLVSENKLKFEINQKAVAKAGLRISSQLLQHAILVNMP